MFLFIYKQNKMQYNTNVINYNISTLYKYI